MESLLRKPSGQVTVGGAKEEKNPKKIKNKVTVLVVGGAPEALNSDQVHRHDKNTSHQRLL